MSTNVAAVAISSAALAQSNSAETQACRAVIKSYKAETATVVEMQNYAKCVRKVHPNDLSGEALIIVKVAIVLVLIGAIVGTWKGWVDDKWLGAGMGFFFGAVVVVCVLFAILLVVYGVHFLFT